jgi:hypothetical protein
MKIEANICALWHPSNAYKVDSAWHLFTYIFPNVTMMQYSLVVFTNGTTKMCYYVMQPIVSLAIYLRDRTTDLYFLCTLTA